MLDRVEITLKAGRGGDGVVSFRREKFVPFGGPDGGDGGDGGDVIIRAEAAVSNLRAFIRKRFFKAGDGEGGKGKRRHGKKGEDLILNVPVGTVVLYKTQISENTIIADLKEAGQQAVVARGGKGGLGNTHFATSTHQAPQIALKGEAGEETSIILEMRLIADVGIIGYPNAGKSTLLVAASRAKPKIASYPFTTLEPVLGVAEVGGQSLVLAEIPGLIDGASLGKGLGHDFLRHILRTKILIHLVDGSLSSPVEAMVKVNNELSLFDSALKEKPQLMVLNKIDLPEVEARLDELSEAFSGIGIKALLISAQTGKGVPQVMQETLKLLDKVNAKSEVSERVVRKVFRPQPKDMEGSILREGDVFIIKVPGPEFVLAKGDLESSELSWQLKQHLRRLGLSKALEKAGIKPGDKVRWGNLEWEWQ